LQNFPLAIRTLLNDPANWVIVEPAFADVEFPYTISRDYLVAAHRVGKNMVWVEEARGTLGETQPLGGSWMRGTIDIFCYTRAKSSKEDHIADARNKSTNMREQVATIIKANWKTIPGVLDAHCVATDAWTEEIDPRYFVKVLTVEAKYEI
jgi:hypothetical protein